MGKATYTAGTSHPTIASIVARCPAMATLINCPQCSGLSTMITGELATVIVHLNDTHRWTREAIADWLDTLDLDLRINFINKEERNDSHHAA